MPLSLPKTLMSIDDYHVMKHRLGRKHEYWDGCIRLSPCKTAIADFERSVASPVDFHSALPIGYELRDVTSRDVDFMIVDFDPALWRLAPDFPEQKSGASALQLGVA